MLESNGKITKVNSELGYAFAEVKGAGKVFVSPNTNFSDLSFDDLKVGDLVRLTVENTDRGLHAASIRTQRPGTKTQSTRSPEAMA